MIQPIDDPLSRGEIHYPLAGGRQGNGPPLGGKLAFGFNRKLGLSEHVERTLGVGKLIILPHLGGGCDGIKHAAIGDTGFGVIGNQMVAVGGDSDAKIAGFCL